MENIELAAILTEMATLLEIQGETNPFRIRAYRNAVYTIQESPDPIRKMVEQGEDLTELPAIGKDMASHITEHVTTGRLSILDQVSKEMAVKPEVDDLQCFSPAYPEPAHIIREPVE